MERLPFAAVCTTRTDGGKPALDALAPVIRRRPRTHVAQVLDMPVPQGREQSASGGWRPPVVVGVSGATGMPVAQAVVERLLALGTPVSLVISNAARLTWEDEMDEPLHDAITRWRASPLFTQYAIGDYRAPIASGTVPTRGMVIVPCSMATVAAVAHGFTTNLLQRAADVHLKEHRPLVVVPRETPLHAGHLENLARLARLGATVLPPEPAFYLRPRSVDDIVQFIAQKALVALGVSEGMDARFTWRGAASDAGDA